MERRVLIALFLCFAVLYAWQALFVKPTPKPSAATAQSVTQAKGVPAAGTSAVTAAPGDPTGVASTAGVPLVADTEARDVRVETADVVAVFTTRGARLRSWRLKRYLDAKHEPVELVANELAPAQPLPFSLRVADNPALTATVNNALFALQGAPPSGIATAPTTLAFEYRDSAGVHARKEFQVEPTTYVVGFRATLAVGDREVQPAIEWGPGLGDPDSSTGRYAVKPGGLLSVDTKVQRLSAADTTKQPVHQERFEYAGIDDHYFMSAAVNPGRATVLFQPLSIPPADPKGTAHDLMAFSIQPEPGSDLLKFYVGPKDFDRLAAVNRDLVRAINFGIFAVIVVPLLRALNWIYGYAGNYGWSIVLLTVFINALMFPLRHKSVVSMRKMQEIQPEAKAIQDRYAKLKATDPAKQKMNQELMALYRERGVNPASGCVPMLLTMPVLYAFYALLTTAIEMRGAPFFGWIHDLSLPDPFYVTPVLMGVSQLWQQKMTPAAGVDPAQQKMMMIMPVVFTFIFLSAPSGVAVYWLISNLWGIGQQYLTNYMIGPPTVRQVRPAAERRMKRVGGGKTEAATRES